MDPATVVKTGRVVRMAEAETMRFVSANTTIPVPKVHNAYVDDSSGYVAIVMDFVQGENLDKAWDRLDSDQRESVVQQLRGYMAQLRQFRGEFIGSIDKTWCNDQYFYDDPSGYGPFETEAAFNLGMVRAMKNDRPWPSVDLTCDMWTNTMVGHDIILTHGDLDPRNILVEGSTVVAILDWEYAGYYPEYWEYCKAFCRPDWEGLWVASRATDRFLKPYFKELAVVWNCNQVIQ